MTTRITHIGGPTALIEVDGWRLLTDPTFPATTSMSSAAPCSQRPAASSPPNRALGGWAATPAIPVHYEGWTHFRQGRGAIAQEFQQGPADIGRRLQWLPIGASVSIAG
jgi:hypothetical protein